MHSTLSTGVKIVIGVLGRILIQLIPGQRAHTTTHHELKMLDEAEFNTFCTQLPFVPSAIDPEKKLMDMMQGTREQKEDIAWRFYAGAKLRGKGFGEIWKRKYLEVPELCGVIGSFSEFHFGSRL